MLTLQLLAGIALLLTGAEFLVRGAVAVAARLGVSPMLIGLTLVGFGTSTPELAASVEAVLSDAPGIVIGNVVGSNIANVLLILGIAALIRPVQASRQAVTRDGLFLLGVTLLLPLSVWTGDIGRATGGAFIVVLLTYSGLSYVLDRRRQDAAAALHAAEAAALLERPIALALAVGLVLAGLIAIVWGAELLVRAAVAIAAAAGVPETVIGLTLVAVGTSLPELATSVVAALRNRPDLALGNLIGSNIFNILGILGIVAVLQPFTVAPQILRLDAWVMLAATVLLLLFAMTGRRVERWEGLSLLTLYALYMAVQFHPRLREAAGLVA